VNWKEQCAVVIPCANEAETIAGVVGAARRFLPEVIVVDDGSSDSTGELARAAGAEVIRREGQHGKGGALRAGWRRAAERGFSWVLTMDGDGQHAAEDMPGFLAAASRGDADLIIGNRMSNAERMPWLRRQVNRWMSRRLSREAGMELPDSQCGFRLMRLSAWATLDLVTEHFEIESEVLLGLAARKYGVKFVPVQVIYRNEQSKIHPWRDTVRWFRWWGGQREFKILSPIALKDPNSVPPHPALSRGERGDRSAVKVGMQHLVLGCRPVTVQKENSAYLFAGKQQDAGAVIEPDAGGDARAGGEGAPLGNAPAS
jgi:glycosyltransferase involved in cell wall biosynthesis